MKTMKINGHVLHVLTDAEAKVYDAEITLRFRADDKWGIATTLNKGDLFEVLTGRNRLDGNIDFAVPEDWLDKQRDRQQALAFSVWDYKDGWAGKPLDMRTLLPALREEIMRRLIETTPGVDDE